MARGFALAQKIDREAMLLDIAAAAEASESVEQTVVAAAPKPVEDEPPAAPQS